jgi:3'(2'), 5'-bisphosphate nucleotidase
MVKLTLEAHGYRQELETAKRTAVRAGAILLEHYARSSVPDKERHDPITEARQLVGAFLVKELKQAFPGDGVLSPEDSDHSNSDSTSRVWMLEPLDGTLEFEQCHDEFAVMIGLSVDGAANLGVIYQPRREKMYYALSGSGAFLIENRATRLLQVARESDPLGMTIVHSRLPGSSESGVLQRGLGVGSAMSYGSIGLNVGLICEGVAHLYVHPSRHTYSWDTCAPEVILHEAGGRMTNRFNASLRYGKVVRNPGPVIASNGAMHDQIVQAAQSSLPG